MYPDNYYYRWYAKGTGFPILQINKGFQNQEPPFYQIVVKTNDIKRGKIIKY
jgi:hypothetical protein